MDAITTPVRVQLSTPGALGFRLETNLGGRVVVSAVERNGPHASALAGLRVGNELVEVAGKRVVAGAPLEDIVPLLQAERSVEQPLSLVFEAQLFASTGERRGWGSAVGGADAPALSVPSAGLYGTDLSASTSARSHLRSATAAIGMAMHTPPRSAPRRPREPGSSSRRIGQHVESQMGPPGPVGQTPGVMTQLPPPPPPPSTPPPETGRHRGPATVPDKAAMAKLRVLFTATDTDNTGDVSMKELIIGLRRNPELCSELGLNPPRGATAREAFEELFKGIDKDNNSMISFQEIKDFVVETFPERQRQEHHAAQVARAAEEAQQAREAGEGGAASRSEVGGLHRRQQPPDGVATAFTVPGGDYLPTWLGTVPSPSNSVHSEVMTVPSSSGWHDGEADEEDDDNEADDFMERRLAEYSILKTHRDRSPVQPSRVLQAMSQPMFPDHPPLPDPSPLERTEPAAPLGKLEPYQDSVMERSCFIFGRKNRVRIAVQQVVKARWFENLVILLIFGNSAALAMYDPLEPDSEHNQSLDVAGKAFTVIFSMEMFLKIIAQGFILDPVVYDPDSLTGAGEPVMIEGGYLRESAWNWLDFFVVVTGWSDFLPGYKNDFGVLRTVRVLRPLRAITAIKSMKTLVSTLMEPAVVKKLANVCLLCSFVFVVFAIIAVNMFNGVLRSRCFSIQNLEEHDDGRVCSIDPESGRQCEDGYFCLRLNPLTGEPNDNPNNGYVSFDNFILANFTIFVMLTLEGWTEIMYMIMDGYGTAAWVYFVGLICTGVFVVINLFLAVISMGYEEQCEKAHEEHKLTQEAHEYLQLIVKNICKALSAPESCEEEKFLRGPDAKTIYWESSIDVHYPNTPRKVLQLRKDTLVDVFTSRSDDANDALVPLEVFRAGLRKFMVGIDAKQESHYESGNIDVVAELKRTTRYFKTQWDRHDNDKDGSLSYEEVQEVLLEASIVCTQEQLNAMFDQMDDDASGEVNMQEFVAWWVNHAHEYGLSIDKGSKPYGVPIELPDPRIKKLLFVLTNPEARGNDLEFSKDMTQRMYQCLDVSGDGKLTVQEVIESLGTPPVDPERDQPKPLEPAVVTKESLRGLNAWKVLRLLTLYTIERRWFNALVTSIVLLNCTVLAMYHYGISSGMVATLEPINFVCTILFAVEMAMKLLGMGFRRYASDTFNLFDGMLVVLSLIELAVPSLPGVSALRSLRIFRIMKLSSTLESFKRVILTILSVLPDLGNFAGLMGLFVFFFSVMGLHLFGGRDPRICDGGLDSCKIPEGYSQNVEGLLESDGEVARVNFHDFGTSVVTVFQILTGEDWNAAMYSCMETYGDVAVVYFLSLTIIGTYVLLNLFLAVLILKTMEAFSPTVDPLARVLARYNRHVNPMEGELVSGPTEQVILDGRALFLFGKHSELRKNLKQVVNNPNFDNFILLCIVVSSIALAVEEPDQTPEVLEVIASLDVFFTVVFTFECVIKIACMGLLCESKHAYLNNTWNMLDFMIVVAGLIDLVMTQQAEGVCSNPLGNANAAVCAELGGTFIKESEIKWVRTFRVLRALRPLRVIKRVPELKQVVNSLFKSIPTLANVAMVLVIFWLIFGILGVQMFSGMFFSCNDGDALGMLDCCGVTVDDTGQLVEREWTNTNYGFDHIGQSVMTLFEVSTLEMWLDIMYSGMDSTQTGLQPVYNANAFMPLFFLIFIMFGSFFLLQLFAGAIVNEYNTLNEQAGGCAFQSARQKRMVQKLVLKHKSELEEPKHDWQRRIVRVTKLPNFRNFISISIVLNVLAMALATNDMSTNYARAIELANVTFTLIFAGEAGFKLLGLGWNYFKKGWNRFDFFVVIVTMFEFIYARTADGDLSFLQLLRTFRILRLFKLFSRMEDLMALFLAVVNAIPTMVNVGGLLFLIFFIYAVLGMHLLGKIKPADDAEFLSDHANFASFGTSLLTVFRMATGESWNGIMHDCMVQPPDCDETEDNCGSVVMAVIYFVSFQLIGQFIMLNLFIAVVLEHYKKATDQTEPVLTEKDFRDFEKVWESLCGSDPRNGGKYFKIMPVELLDELMTALPQHIGWGPHERVSRKTNIRKMQALRGALQPLPMRAIHVMVPRWTPNSSRTVWPPKRIYGEESDDEGQQMICPPSPTSQRNSVTSTAMTEVHYYHFSEVWHTLFARAETVAMLDPANDEMTENQKERRLKQFRSIMATAKDEIFKDISASIEHYGNLSVVRRPRYYNANDAVLMSGGPSVVRPLKLEAAGRQISRFSEAGMSEFSGNDGPQPLGGGVAADDPSAGQMCTCAETFAALLIQRAVRRLAEPHRRRFRPDDGWTDPSSVREFFQRCPNHSAIQQLEDPTHPYYDSAAAEEWYNIKIRAAKQRQQGVSKEQNRQMRDKIHEIVNEQKQRLLKQKLGMASRTNTEIWSSEDDHGPSETPRRRRSEEEGRPESVYDDAVSIYTAGDEKDGYDHGDEYSYDGSQTPSEEGSEGRQWHANVAGMDEDESDGESDGYNGASSSEDGTDKGGSLRMAGTSDPDQTRGKPYDVLMPEAPEPSLTSLEPQHAARAASMLERPGMGEFANVPGGGVHLTAATDAQRAARLDQLRSLMPEFDPRSEVENLGVASEFESDPTSKLVPIPEPEPQVEPLVRPAVTAMIDADPGSPIVPDGYHEMNVDDQLEHLLGNTDALLAAAMGSSQEHSKPVGRRP